MFPPSTPGNKQSPYPHTCDIRRHVALHVHRCTATVPRWRPRSPKPWPCHSSSSALPCSPRFLLVSLSSALGCTIGVNGEVVLQKVKCRRERKRDEGVWEHSGCRKRLWSEAGQEEIPPGDSELWGDWLWQKYDKFGWKKTYYSCGIWGGSQ